MRQLTLLLTVLALTGCHREPPPAPAPDIGDPATFSSWPRVTERPVAVSTAFWMDCRLPTPEQARAGQQEAKAHGPHAKHFVVVRVSPDAVAEFREGRPLATGAVVVKEKYIDAVAAGPLQEYAVMVKREAGYDPGAGDWEYAYVTLTPVRVVSHGRLAECAGCHASARERDYLFRSYTGVGESQKPVEQSVATNRSRHTASPE
jgi:hypothetical protein